MSKFVVTVHQIFPTPQFADKGETIATQEVFKLGVDEFDPVRFVTALMAKKQGRPAKSAKKEAQT